MTATADAPPRRRHMVSRTAIQLAGSALETDDRAAWLALRREGIGGSDIAPILGLGEYGRTAWQVWQDKVSGERALDEPDEATAERYRWGHRGEAGAVEEFRLRYPGARMARVGMLAHADHEWMRVNLDRRVYGCPEGGPCLLEIKTRDRFAAREWDPGDPERVPDAPAIQTQWGLAITGWVHGHLAVVIGGNQMHDYIIRADPAMQADMQAAASDFWHRHVLTGQMPPVDASERTGRILARLWEVEPEKIKTAGAYQLELLAGLRGAVDRGLAAREDAQGLAHELQAWLGECEVATDAAGRALFTWKQNSTFRDKAFRADHPELAAQFTRRQPVTDTAALAAAHPEVYRAYRARQFRLCPDPTEGE